LEEESETARDRFLRVPNLAGEETVPAVPKHKCLFELCRFKTVTTVPLRNRVQLSSCGNNICRLQIPRREKIFLD
jgi:hypothetical protein